MLPSDHALGLPGTRPSGRRQFPRLQLRGSAGFSPASLSSPSGEDARSERHHKEQDNFKTTAAKNLTAESHWSQMHLEQRTLTVSTVPTDTGQSKAPR